MKIHKKLYQHTLLGLEDRVFANAPISHEGGKFLGAWGECHAVSTGVQNIQTAVMIMARGVVVIDPNFGTSGFDVDELWDALVPKDEAQSVTAGNRQIDMETEIGDEDTTTFSEPGFPNPTVLAEGDGIWAQRIYDYQEILTFAKTSDGFLDGTPDTYIPNTIFRPSASQRVMMHDVPGYVLFALGNPLLDATTTSVEGTFFNVEWLMLRHLTRLMDEAWMQWAGLDEAGAESPHLDMATLIVRLTEPSVVEETAAAWAQWNANVWSMMNIITEVPRSDITPTTLSSG